MRQLRDEASTPIFRVLESLVVKLAPGCNADCRFTDSLDDVPATQEVARIERRVVSAPRAG
jgi:hypothetical protein